MSTSTMETTNLEIPEALRYDLPRWDGVNRVGDWISSPERSILLVHDMQNHFVDKYAADAEPMNTVLGNIAELIAQARRLGIPVVYSAQPGDQDPDERALLTDFWGYGPRTADTGIVGPLAPADASEVMRKWRYSAFQRTDLLERLRAEGRDQLVITGVYAFIGCLATALEGFMSDVQSFIVADAVADFTAEDHVRALEWVSARCGVVATMQQLGGQWKLQTVIRESAALLDLPATEITADSDLADLGLDSVRFIQLAMKLKKQGMDVPLERLVQGGPISGWLKEV